MMQNSTPFALRLSWAQGLFDRGEYISAAVALAELVEEIERPVPGAEVSTGSTDLRLLLGRAYFHSAQLGKAEEVLVRIVDEHPTEAYAQLLLGRTLQRAGRHDEAARPLALAAILGDFDRPAAYATGGAA